MIDFLYTEGSLFFLEHKDGLQNMASVGDTRMAGSQVSAVSSGKNENKGGNPHPGRLDSWKRKYLQNHW